MSLTQGTRPSLKDKLIAQEKSLKAEAVAVDVEITAVEGAKKRAYKKKV